MKLSKGVLNLACGIEDKNGDRVSLGDKIVVILPEISISNQSAGDVFLPEIKLLGELGLRLSTGLMLNKIKIIECDYPEESFIKNGQSIKFKRFAWDWYKK